MDLDVIARLAASAKKQSDLDETINVASRHATPDQLRVLKEIKKSNSCRLAVARREGTLDFDGRVSEALRVLEALYSLKNGKTTLAGYTRRSLKNNGYVEALRKIVAKRDSHGLRTLAKYDRLDCAFEQIALDFPQLFSEGNTLIIAQETLDREQQR